jgi:hypothetical protein
MMITIGSQCWYGMGDEACVAFVVALHDDGTVARLWAVSRLAGGILWVDDPPQADAPTPGAWWPR